MDASRPASSGVPPLATTGSEPGLPSPENKLFYPALDGLRAVAVLLVFFQHYLSGTHPALNWGWTGVDLFFVLSGFLITGILYDTRNTSHRFRNFYARRTLRIFPLYYAVLFGALLTTPVFHWVWSRSWIFWFLYLGNYVHFFHLHDPLALLGVFEQLRSAPLSNASFTLYLGHFWSLCVEEQFYLVWPLVVFTVRRRETLRTLCLLSIPLVLLARILCVWSLPQAYLHAGFLYSVTPLRADALLLGGLCALALRGPEAAWVLRWARPLLPAAVAAVVLWQVLHVALSPAHTVYRLVTDDPWVTTIGYTLIDLFAALLILNLLSLDHPLARLFNLRPLRALGRISYGFYVLHDLFHNAYFLLVKAIFGDVHTGGLLLVAAVAFVGTLLLASLSYRFFETPFLRLKSRFSPHA